MSNRKDRLVLDNIDEQVELTIDCTDPLFANNANCLVYSSGDGDVSASTNGGQIVTLIVIGSLIVVILIVYLIVSIFKSCK